MLFHLHRLHARSEELDELGAVAAKGGECLCLCENDGFGHLSPGSFPCFLAVVGYSE